nr:MAG TPA: hypothetical protein [Caudoviricetes sp.]
MVPNSMNEHSYTEQEIKEMQQVLLETPIDTAYDNICNSFYDGWDRTVHRQMYVRDCYSILKELDQLPASMK